MEFLESCLTNERNDNSNERTRYKMLENEYNNMS